MSPIDYCYSRQYNFESPIYSDIVYDAVVSDDIEYLNLTRNNAEDYLDD